VSFSPENNRMALIRRLPCVCVLTMLANAALGQTVVAPGAPGATMGAATNFNANAGNPVFGAFPPPRPFAGTPGALNFNMGSGFFGRSLSAPAAAPVYSFSGTSGAAAGGASGGALRAGVIDDFKALGDMR
jgi:hypothetical protein